MIMNKRSILSILVILLALSLTLGAVSAADNATETSDVASDAAPVESDIPTAGGSEDIPVADVGVDVEELYDGGDYIVWSVLAYNNGPDTAEDVVVYNFLSDNQLPFFVQATQGVYLEDSDVWYVGDLEAGAVALMYLFTETLDEGPFYYLAVIDSSAYDPDWSNNFDVAVARAGSEPVAVAETLPEAGNPLQIIGMSACLAGAVCGDHCSPISDTTIMSSAGAQCDHVSHVSTQIPYALTVAAVSFVGYVVAGFVNNWYISFAATVVLLLAVLFVIKATAKNPPT